jgi:hypothetical protein
LFEIEGKNRFFHVWQKKHKIFSQNEEIKDEVGIKKRKNRHYYKNI